ncbi:hypothetical protein [Paenibacillus daejeonensis]|uniref:hypothetical protein n=1 Tax=Paenibacillus daejeonensis TaxID=135193 RepID=UPI00036A3660|nr:hypothetical protein [Paenibacillus daejeonensis]
MGTVLYFLFSGIEWLALILLTFAMFKFPLKGFRGQILFASAIMALLSHFIFEVLELRVIATLLQPPVIFLILWQMFRVHIFYAALMTVYGYMGYLFIQYFFLILMIWMDIPLEVLMPHTNQAYVLQSLSVMTTLVIVGLLYRFRIGYTFVPDYEYAPLTMRGLNLKLFFLILGGYGVISITNFIAFSKSTPTLAILNFIIILGVLLYVAQRREYIDDRSMG